MARFLQRVDDLCAVVVAEGMLCSTPLAEYRVPAAYDQSIYDSQEGATAWFKIMESRMPNVAVNTANIYKSAMETTSIGPLLYLWWLIECPMAKVAGSTP